MSQESSALRALAAAIDRLELMTRFMADGSKQQPDVGDVRVIWNWASSCSGYTDLSVEMSKIVGEQWLAIRDEAIRRKALEVDQLRQELETIRSQAAP